MPRDSIVAGNLRLMWRQWYHMDPYGTQSLRSWRKALGRHLQHFVTFVDTFLGKQRKTWKNNIKIKANKAPEPIGDISYRFAELVTTRSAWTISGSSRVEKRLYNMANAFGTEWHMDDVSGKPETSLRRLEQILMEKTYETVLELRVSTFLKPPTEFHHANYSATSLHLLPQLKWFQDFQVSCQSLLTQPLGPNVDRARRGQYHPKLPTNSTVSRPQNSTIRNKNITVTFRGIVEMNDLGIAKTWLMSSQAVAASPFI